MKIEQQKSLKDLNTFGIEVFASEFLTIKSETDLIAAIHAYSGKDFFVLSGGSNMLLTKDINALVLHIAIKGITAVVDTEDTILITAKAGENWHNFVRYCIDNDYGGLENLSLIPGYVGSAPIQNIGAYGVELKDCFVSCEAVEKKTGNKRKFLKKDCNFGYRNSVFKNALKGKYIITEVTFGLTLKNHSLRTDYGSIKEFLSRKQIKDPTIKDISDAVISIRESKLPDPSKIGNSGSFFKNPVIPLSHYNSLKTKYPEIPAFKIDQTHIKVPAGWLIETCGFKGKRWGDVGVHSKQALVLVNYGKASGKEILSLSQRIQKTVKDRFGISLETEVNII